MDSVLAVHRELRRWRRTIAHADVDFVAVHGPDRDSALRLCCLPHTVSDAVSDAVSNEVSDVGANAEPIAGTDVVANTCSDAIADTRADDVTNARSHGRAHSSTDAVPDAVPDAGARGLCVECIWALGHVLPDVRRRHADTISQRDHRSSPRRCTVWPS